MFSVLRCTGCERDVHDGSERQIRESGHQKAAISDAQKACGQTGYNYCYHYTTSVAEYIVEENNGMSEAQELNFYSVIISGWEDEEWKRQFRVGRPTCTFNFLCV